MIDEVVVERFLILIKDYIRNNLRIEARTDLEGNTHLVLTLENELISNVKLEFVEDEESNKE